MIRGAAFVEAHIVKRDAKEVTKQLVNETSLNITLSEKNQTLPNGTIIGAAVEANGTTPKISASSEPSGSIHISIATGAFVLAVLAFIGSLASF
ncbi:hypothetical protein MERGE_002592 [Pneumocystis wakefieldiae]|uniref:Uncharacterized protein n=1 Tax=Pneumocystis wakefieldiae TaxID=38082 RepID=A0A899FXD0_9ASCO|nr:hypothetical protein MERGE_002592 [Pneumocystis wakefieldiae]